MHEGLVAVARLLLRQRRGRPDDTERRRAVSSAYYAVFHAFCLAVVQSRHASGSAWTDESIADYRRLRHYDAKQRCRIETLLQAGFDDVFVRIGAAFIDLQAARHNSDYDPSFYLSVQQARIFVSKAEDALEQLDAVTEPQRRAFAEHLLAKPST